MKKKKTLLVRTVAAGGVCAVLMGAGNAPQAVAQDAKMPKVNKVSPEQIGWGEPKDGLQLGLFPQSEQKSFRYGDTLLLVLRARNVSAAPIALTMKTPQISSVTLGEKRRLVLQTLGPSGDVVPLRLAPGQTAELPGGRYAAQIAAVGETEPPRENSGPVLPLLPGTYHIECSTPIWMPDKDDASRATGHRAKPGIFTFTVRDAARHSPVAPQKEKANVKASDAAIAWGESVNGLQGGIMRIAEKNLSRLADAPYKSIAADEILARYYIRNTTSKPLAISHQPFDENDASPWVTDAKGAGQTVRTVFLSGIRAMQEDTLQPGEIRPVGWRRLHLQTQQSLPAAEYTPMLTAPTGQYNLRLIYSVRFSGHPNLDIVLISGSAPFVIPPN